MSMGVAANSSGHRPWDPNNRLPEHERIDSGGDSSMNDPLRHVPGTSNGEEEPRLTPQRPDAQENGIDTTFSIRVDHNRTTCNDSDGPLSEPPYLSTIDWHYPSTTTTTSGNSNHSESEFTEPRITTLLPRTSIRDSHDERQEHELDTVFPINDEADSMGYSNNGETLPSTWSAMEHEKMNDRSQEHDSEHHEGKHREEDDDTTVQSFDSATVDSPALAPVQGLSTAHHTTAGGQLPSTVETPSTVSTAESTDEASWADLPHRADAPAQGDFYNHQRVPSWEQSPRQHFFASDQEHGFGSQALPPPFQPPQPAGVWGNVQQRVTSFRSDYEPDRSAYPPMSPSESRWLPPQTHRFSAPQLPFLPGRGTPPIDNRMHRPTSSGFHPYQIQQQQPQQQKKPGAFALPSALTPPRGVQRQRLPPSSPHRGPVATGFSSAAGQSAGGSRSSSEVLKTLLRKKACLYEPDTSRAVALVTWLVGRELALEQGFFSRQQLQAGVHACVADKINLGVITRTKVNRCMQIILNSCFHYIIPRPDGTEENGDSFRYQFAREVDDDSFLLRVLPDPWNDLVVDGEEILAASAAEAAALEPGKSKKTGSGLETPQSSPRLTSASPDKSPGKESHDSGDDQHKRAVLLCFNENVRKAEDVFRCHNEFIRDTAHASHLQLSSQEWRVFFGPEAAASPHLWGNIGIPVPFSEIHGSSHVDALGMMTTDEAAKFRTSWCTKRYDHDHELCGFAHAEMNGGWLRRNPTIYQYRDEMCPSVSDVTDKRLGPGVFVLNECRHGVGCEFAHSSEEITYHPRRYKMRACPSSGRPGGCHLGDVCPSFHPVDTYRFPKKSESRSSRHARHSHPAGGTKGQTTAPVSSPILYASPAPVSSFEEHLLLPGLQNLYRRNCSVIRAHLRKPGCTCYYGYFGDDVGLSGDTELGRPRSPRGLPHPPGERSAHGAA